MNSYLWNNDEIGDISNIDKIIPNNKQTHKKIDQLIKWCSLAYREQKDKYGYVNNNLSDNNYNGIGNSSILVFDDTYSTVSKYFLHGTLTIDNQEEKEWINEKIDLELRNVPLSVQWMKREELKIKFKKEFRDNAKRTILAYRSQTWRIEDNKIMVTNHEDFHNQNFVDAIELINKNTDRIVLTKHYTDNFFDIFCIETKDGFVFQVNK